MVSMAELLRAFGVGDQSTVDRRLSTQKRRKPHDLVILLESLPAGRRRVAEALVMVDEAPTYAQVAATSSISLGTVHRHLKRIRELHPDVYEALMTERRRQLAERHERAVEREAARSRRWHKRQANRKYYYRFGRWPWQPRQ